jgi:hypothetical protein
MHSKIHGAFCGVGLIVSIISVGHMLYILFKYNQGRIAAFYLLHQTDAEWVLLEFVPI